MSDPTGDATQKPPTHIRVTEGWTAGADFAQVFSWVKRGHKYVTNAAGVDAKGQRFMDYMLAELDE